MWGKVVASAHDGCRVPGMTSTNSIISTRTGESLAASPTAITNDVRLQVFAPIDSEQDGERLMDMRLSARQARAYAAELISAAEAVEAETVRRATAAERVKSHPVFAACSEQARRIIAGGAK